MKMIELNLTEKTKDRLYLALLVCAGFFMIGTSYLIGNHIDVFQKDPFRYGASKLGNAECICNRYDMNENYLYSFGFNSTSIWNIGQSQSQNEFGKIGGDGFLQIK